MAIKVFVCFPETVQGYSIFFKTKSGTVIHLHLQLSPLSPMLLLICINWACQIAEYMLIQGVPQKQKKREYIKISRELIYI